MQFTAQQIAALIGAHIEGDATASVNRPSKIEEGGEGSISFLSNPKYEPYLYSTTASVVVVANDLELKQAVQTTLLRVPNVYESFAQLLAFYDQAAQARPQGISPQSYVDASAQLGADVAVGRFSTIERGARLGKGVVIFDQVYVGANAVVGDNTIIFPGVRLLHGCQLGSSCIIHANVVIGSDGFGFAPDANGVYQKVPQVGRVVVGNDVEIGAGTTIDRATMGETRIEDGVKLDNLVQIGHNVTVGAHTVIAAQTGVAGSTKIGRHCRIGGQVGFVGHATIADGTQIQAQSGIAASIETPNQAWFGSPAIGYRDYIRAYAVFKDLPALSKQVYKLNQAIEELRNM